MIVLEATPGIEPGYTDLQSAASPLRHVAIGLKFLAKISRVSSNSLDLGPEPATDQAYRSKCPRASGRAGHVFAKVAIHAGAKPVLTEYRKVPASKLGVRGLWPLLR